jgi:methyl-accepting chemotaxis protein
MEPASPLEHKKVKRSIYLINRKLQFRYIAVIFLTIIAFSLVLGVDFYFSIVRKIALKGYPELYDMLVNLNIIMMIKYLIYSVAILVLALLISHRFAGPVFRFEKGFEILSTGDLTHRITLRKEDELIELKDLINKMTESLQAKVLYDRTVVHELSEKVSGILRAIDTAGLPQDKSQLLKNDLQTLQTQLRTITSGFKV